MSEATPGPWEICEADGEDIWICEENDPGHNVGICVVEAREEDKANARLIAAAPDLLEALKALVQFTDDDFITAPGGFQKLWTDARAAVAKATGKA